MKPEALAACSQSGRGGCDSHSKAVGVSAQHKINQIVSGTGCILVLHQRGLHRVRTDGGFPAAMQSTSASCSIWVLHYNEPEGMQ